MKGGVIISKDELVKQMKGNIRGALNLALIMIDGETDAEQICNRLNATIEILKKDVEALERIDDYLHLRELFDD